MWISDGNKTKFIVDILYGRILTESGVDKTHTQTQCACVAHRVCGNYEKPLDYNDSCED